MTRVDFYILEGSEPGDIPLFACRLAEKAYQLGFRTYIRTESMAQTGHLDALLWTYRQGSFLPHEIVTGHLDPNDAPPVLVGHEEAPGDGHQVLINLATALPATPNDFEVIKEVVDQVPERLGPARERYRWYQDQGYELTSHKMS